MLAVDKVSVQFLGRALYKDLSFTVNPKDRICFAGPNGTGKSTLMKIIAGLMSPDSGSINRAKYIEVGYLPQEGVKISGKTLYQEAETAFEDAVQLKEKLDDASNQLGELDPSSTEYADALAVYGELQLSLDNCDVGTMKPRIEKVLTGLGFSFGDFDRDVDEFSGGWQMRIALAKLLLRNPPILLLDEPTNHLDMDSQLWLESYIQNYGGAIILISHDSAFLDSIVMKTLAFEGGKVNEFAGNYTSYLEQSDILRKQIQRAYNNQQREIAKAEQFINRFRSKARRASQAQSRLKQLEKIERIELAAEPDKTIKLRFPQPERSGQIVIELLNVNRSYGENVVFNQLNVRIDRGEKIAVVGNNGAGKSTFSRILSGSDPVNSGARKVGHKVTVSHFAQDHAEKLNPSRTVLETIEEVAGRDIVGNLRSLLGCFLFRGDDVFKKVSVLSGGERSRLSLAKILLRPANFLILDEPTNHLDMQSQKVLQKALIAYQGTMVIVSHNRDFLDPITNKVIEFYSDDRSARTFPGNLSAYIEKRKEEENTTAPTQETSSTPASTPSNNRKKKRKIEGKIRQERADILKPLQAKLDDLEAEIKKTESRKLQIETAMTDPNFFKGKEGIKTAAEYKDLNATTEKLYTEWSSVSDEVEKVNTAFTERLGPGSPS